MRRPIKRPMQSAIYEGSVRHGRQMEPRHGFTKRLFMLYLDLAELDRVFEGRWLWGVERSRLVSFRRRDHLGDPALPLDQAVRALVHERTGRALEGPIRLLTQMRTAGYVFNPVSLYYGFKPSGELDAVVADVSNTPWNERHAYVLPAKEGRVDARAEKEFHVSPFLPMSHEYRFTVEPPGATLRARIENFARGERVFDASLELERREIGTSTLASTLARFPWMTLEVIAAIYWQAFRLHRLGAAVYPHPGKAKRVEALT
jgi:uncharacterized protein